MAKKLAVAVIHGMGSQEQGFSKPMVEELKDRVSRQGKNAADVAWGEIYWANVLQPRQRKYLEDANAKNDLDYTGLRKFVISAVGDAAAYRKVDSLDNTTYRIIHRRVRKVISTLAGEVDAEKTPLVVLAHSLGGHIMSNYIWDMQTAVKEGKTGIPQTSFERMETLAGIVTFGCNIPLFTFAYKTVKPIKFPGSNLTEEVRKEAKWWNYFDTDDVLGYPLKPINKAYGRVVHKDVPINVGGLFSSWNPMSHSKYWTDDDFTEPVAEFLTRLF